MIDFQAELKLQTKILLKRINIEPHEIRFEASYGNSLITWNGCLTIELQREFIGHRFLEQLQAHFGAIDVEWSPISHVKHHPHLVETHGWALRLIQIDKSLYQHHINGKLNERQL